MSEPAFHQFKLRLPLDLFRELEVAAGAANRSVSAEMIYRLEQSIRTAHRSETPFAKAATEEDMEEIIIRVAKGLIREMTPAEGGNGLREEPQAPAKLDRWAKPKVRPEPPQYPKPKKHK